MIFGEEPAPSMLKVKHTNHRVLIDQGNGQLRSRFGIQRNVTRVFAHVRNQNGVLVLGRVSDQTSSNRNLVFQLNVFLEAQREPVL